MNLDISFGQYCEGNSIIHRMDPRAKIVAAVLYIVTVFLAKNLYAFGLLLLSVVVLVAVSRIPVRVVLKSMKPLIVTTNISYEDIKNPRSDDWARIWSRINARAIPINFSGTDKRSESAAKLRDETRRQIDNEN